VDAEWWGFGGGVGEGVCEAEGVNHAMCLGWGWPFRCSVVSAVSEVWDVSLYRTEIGLRWAGI